jgi:hypothetical protein
MGSWLPDRDQPLWVRHFAAVPPREERLPTIADLDVPLIQAQSLRPVTATVTPKPIIVSPPTPPTRESR